MAQRISNVSNQSLEEFDLKESNSEADFNVDDAERKGKRKDSKRLFTKKEAKDKGYSTLDADNSQESIFLMNNKTSKKTKQDVKIGLFKKNSTKEEKKAKDVINTDSTKRSKIEKRKKAKENESAQQNVNKILFGETLENTIAAYPCNDGLNIPYPIRMCLDIIEEKGLEYEGIYRKIRNKSQVDSIYEAINTNFESKLNDISADPLIAASIVKKFFRELKVPLINEDLLNLFEKCEQLSDKDVDLKIESIRKTLKKLPTANRDTLSFLIVHLSKVMQKSEVNKMDLQNIILTFQSIICLKDRLFKFILKNSSLILKDFHYRKYRNKIADDTITRLSMLPDSVQDLENEIANQEKILNELHAKIALNEKDQQMQEELWAIQRYVTSLKRKVKKIKTEQKASIDKQVQEIVKIAKNEEKLMKSQLMETQKSEITKQEEEANNKTIEIMTKNLEEEELNSKEELIKIICENEILVETLQTLFEKLSREKVKIFDLQQQHKTLAFQKPINHVIEVTNYETVNLNDLQRNLEQIVNENKLFEDKINNINEKIALEKQKIFELKSVIKYNDFKNIAFNQDITKVNNMSAPTSPIQIISSNNKITDNQVIVSVESGVTTKL